MVISSSKMSLRFVLLLLLVRGISMLQQRQQKLQHRLLQTNLFPEASQTIRASESQPYDYFGSGFDFYGSGLPTPNALAIYNDSIVVGSVGLHSIYVFVRSKEETALFSQVAILEPSDGFDGDFFGFSVDIFEDWIVAGAPDAVTGAGAVYVFQIIQENGSVIGITQTAKVIAPDDGSSPIDNFGSSVSIHGNFIWVGSILYNFAFVFADLSSDHSGQNWTQVSQFRTTGPSFYGVGYTIAFDGATAVVGTSEEDTVEPESYAHDEAYVYEVQGNNMWTQTARLTGFNNSKFGRSVAVARNWMVVGSTKDTNDDGIIVGSAFVYNKIDISGTWTQVTKLFANDGAVNSSFGASLAIAEDASVIIVGALDKESPQTNQDSVYLFQQISKSGWTQVGKFLPPSGALDDKVGFSVSLSHATIAIGAFNFNTYNGSVYVVNTKFAQSTAVPSTIQSSTLPTSHPTILSFTPTVPLLTDSPTPTTTPEPYFSPTDIPVTPNMVGNSRQQNSDGFALEIGISAAALVVAVAIIAGAMLIYKKWTLQQQQQTRMSAFGNYALPPSATVALVDRPLMPDDPPMLVRADPPSGTMNAELVDVVVDHYPDQEVITDCHNLPPVGPHYKDQIQSVAKGTPHSNY